MLLWSLFSISLGADTPAFVLDDSQKMLDHRVGVCLASTDTSNLFQSGFYQFQLPPSVQESSHCSVFCPTLDRFSLFLFIFVQFISRQSRDSIVVSHCSFNLYSPDDQWRWAPLSFLGFLVCTWRLLPILSPQDSVIPFYRRGKWFSWNVRDLPGLYSLGPDQSLDRECGDETQRCLSWCWTCGICCAWFSEAWVLK